MSGIDVRGIGMTSQRTRERLIERLSEQGISDMRVLEIIRITPRHLFLDEALAHRAYEDAALPIGYNQTLSQPYTVARMTELLLAGCNPKRVLEIGTGSGYQTVVLAQLVEEVFTLERIRPLLDRARRRFTDLKLYNIQSRHGDGYSGWIARAPFDAIIVTAAPRDVPAELVAQLRVGGRMVIPIGTGREQQLKIVTRTDAGFDALGVESANFVPFVAGTRR